MISFDKGVIGQICLGTSGCHRDWRWRWKSLPYLDLSDLLCAGHLSSQSTFWAYSRESGEDEKSEMEDWASKERHKWCRTRRCHSVNMKQKAQEASGRGNTILPEWGAGSVFSVQSFHPSDKKKFPSIWDKEYKLGQDLDVSARSSFTAY